MLSDCTMRKRTLPKEPLLGSLSRECPLGDTTRRCRPSQAKPLLITDTAHAGRKAPSVHHPRALVGCMLRSAQLARSHAPARCALVAAVLPVIQARRSCLCMPLRRAEAAAANFTSILIVPHALGLLATADEGKLASAAVLERGAHRQKSLCSSPGTPHAEPLGVSKRRTNLAVSTVSEQARRSM